ncbi:SecDF P1 head subdomain-containing protein [Rubricoccus marinus]|uniref:SecDF P1 head subdomain-containing protein n=1 Tax=Rubricoccus marinus TaxID=716817 RepID=UPI0015C58A68|nr:hypothetical protein [Rubricoccus marinus]
MELREAVVPSWYPLRADLAETTGMTGLPGPDGETIYVGELLLELSFGDVESVGVTSDPLTSVPLVSLAFAPEASKTLAEITGDRIGQPLAVVFEDRVLSAPRINGRITGGRMSIEGTTLEEAEDIAASIREAVGGLTPWEYARRTIDTSTPEATVVSLERVLRLGDWQSATRPLHPDAVTDLRGAIGSAAIRLVGDEAEGIAGTIDGLRLPLAEVLGSVPPGRSFGDLSDTDALALAFALTTAAGTPMWSSPIRGETLGITTLGDRAYVVQGDTFLEADGLTSATVIALERLDSPEGHRWVVLFSLP